MPDPRDEERPGLAPRSAPPASAKPARSDPARARFVFIAAHRVVGAVLVMLGILAMQRALDWGEGLGIALAVVGLVDFFVIPLVLARMWRSRPE